MLINFYENLQSKNKRFKTLFIHLKYIFLNDDRLFSRQHGNTGAVQPEFQTGCRNWKDFLPVDHVHVNNTSLPFLKIHFP
jgi:hypothetical protein